MPAQALLQSSCPAATTSLMTFNEPNTAVQINGTNFVPSNGTILVPVNPSVATVSNIFGGTVSTVSTTVTSTSASTAGMWLRSGLYFSDTR